MLVIREAQLDEFSKAARKMFCRRLSEHIRKCWPEEFEKRTAEGVRQSIEHGVARAIAHGLSSKRDIVRYVDAMFLLGDDDFDMDPRRQWARSLLASTAATPAEKALRIWEGAKLERL